MVLGGVSDYVRGLMDSGYVIGAILCILIIAVMYYITKRCYKGKKAKKATKDTTDDESQTEIQKIIDSIEDAQIASDDEQAPMEKPASKPPRNGVPRGKQAPPPSGASRGGNMAMGGRIPSMGDSIEMGSGGTPDLIPSGLGACGPEGM